MSGPTRLLRIEDAPRLTALVVANREYLRPTDPDRPDAYFTETGQRVVVEQQLALADAGTGLPHAILDEDGRIVGRITLSGIVRGPLQSASLGYWLARDATGRGLAARAAREMVRIAFEELELHRVEAGTLVDNVRSQRVLAASGFVRYGLAPRYLRIAGAWRDHILFQRLVDD